MKHDFEDLLKFIEANPNDWDVLLKKRPYSLKSVKKSVQNPNWYILMYNLFERNSLAYNEVLGSRGCVVEVKDGKAKMICAPFFKFFNHGEGECENVDFSNPLTFCTEKRDGWICKASKVDGKLYWFTQSTDLTPDSSAPVDPFVKNGLSFKNMYEVWEHAWNRENHDFVNELPDGCTLIFELESAWNEIHTKSNWEPKLWFIGYRDENLMEHRVHELKDIVPFEIPKEYSFKSWKDVKALLDTWNGEELEGIVACQPRPDGHFNRAKIKCDDYLRIKMEARFREGFVPTTRNIFNLVVDGEFDDLLPYLGDVVKYEIFAMAERFNALKECWREGVERVKVAVPADEFYSDKYYKDTFAWLMSNGYGNNKVIMNAIKGDFNSAWSDFVENMRLHTRKGWKDFLRYEELMNSLKK